MTPERWKRTEELYHAAHAMPEAEREAFLADACPDDEPMRRNVQSLLEESESRADDFLEQPAAMTGVSIGGYQLRTLLGVGGMGEVYLALDPTLGRDVAIKILPRAFTSDPQRLARFEREARMLASLNHPNICAIYGFKEAEGIRFLILELVHGETLAQRLAQASGLKAQGLPVGEALAIARQIAEALEAAHERGIVHRDLKPANIKITAEGAVKVLDFGLAKATEESAVASGDTAEGIILGTAAYMSPEQARGKATDKRTDIWAFGCVLYEMLTGRGTFAGETVSDTLGKILEREPDWTVLPASTPPAIRRLLLRCLAKDPKQRLRDIGEARIEIDAIDQIPAGASAIAPPSAPERTRRTMWLPWLVAAALVAAVGVWEARRYLNASEKPPVHPYSVFLDGEPLAKATFTPITNGEGSKLDAAISSDGRFVAYMSDQDGPFHAFLAQVGSDGLRPLTPGMADQLNAGPTRSVGFSADGSNIWINGTRGRRLRLLSLLDNAPRAFLSDKAVNVAWSRDGKRLAYFTFEDGDPLMVADGTGDNPRPILPSEKGVHHHFPAWSVDGQWIYYVRGRIVPPDAEVDIWRIPSSGLGEGERLIQLGTDVRYLTPIDARTVLYVAPAEDGSGKWLWALDVERREKHRISAGPYPYLSVAASADGHRLVATVAKSSAALWSVPILDGHRVADERDVKPHPPVNARALAPRFAGTSLFYLSSSGGSGDGLWRLQDGQSKEIWKGSSGMLVEPPAVSPVSRRVAVALKTQGKLHLTLVSADGADHNPLAGGIQIKGAFDWSPDEKWIVTGGSDAQGPGLFKIPVAGGEPVRLVNGPAFDPVWSPTADVIVYTGEQMAKAPLLAVRPDSRPMDLPTIRVPFGGYGRARFLPNGDLVYLQGGPGSAQEFWRLDLATGQRRLLAKLQNTVTPFAFDVTPDGTHIVFDRVRENSDIVLIDLPKH